MNGIEKLKFCIKWAHHAKKMDRIPEVKELFGMCEDALREKLERSKGCEFCRAIYTKGDWAESGVHDFRLHEGVLYYYDERFGWEGIKVKYCPMCGRKLSAPSAAQGTTTL